MKNLNVLLVIVLLLSINAVSQISIISTEEELLKSLVDTDNKELQGFSFETIEKIQGLSEELLLAVSYFPEENTILFITPTTAVAASEEFDQFSSKDITNNFDFAEIKISILDAYSLIKLQTKDEIFGIFLEQEEEILVWNVVTRSEVFSVSAMFASTIRVSNNKEVLKFISDKLQKMRNDKTEQGERPFTPPGLDNKPDDPGIPDVPGKPDDPGKPEEPGKPDNVP